MVFYTYYQDPDFVPDEASQATACKANVSAERALAKAVADRAVLCLISDAGPGVLQMAGRC